jgi:hypothetical protein
VAALEGKPPEPRAGGQGRTRRSLYGRLRTALYFSASDVMSFLGRKLTGRFQGEVVSDQREVSVS